MIETIKPASKEEDILLLRQIADYGLVWKAGSRNPTVHYENGGMKDIEPLVLARMIQEEILSAELNGADTGSPVIEYKLTRKGANMVLASFKGLHVQLFEAQALTEASFKEPIYYPSGKPNEWTSIKKSEWEKKLVSDYKPDSIFPSNADDLS